MKRCKNQKNNNRLLIFDLRRRGLGKLNARSPSIKHAFTIDKARVLHPRLRVHHRNVRVCHRSISKNSSETGTSYGSSQTT